MFQEPCLFAFQCDMGGVVSGHSYGLVWLGRFVESFSWQHHLILVVFFFGQVVLPTQESVQLGGVLSGSIDEREIKPGQEEGPVCLLAVQVLRLPEVCEVPMVVQNLYHVLGSFKNVSPLF